MLPLGSARLADRPYDVSIAGQALMRDLILVSHNIGEAGCPAWPLRTGKHEAS